MRKILYILLSFFSFLNTVNSQRNYISYYLIHTGVDVQIKEQKIQDKILTKQKEVLVAEELNKKSTNKLQTKYAKIKERLNSLSLLFDAIMISPNSIPAIKSTIKNQEDIIQELKDAPYLAPIAVASEKEFVDKTEMIIRFITGLALSYGDINQMKPGDRKMLLNHAIDEINTLNSLSYETLSIIKSIKVAIFLKKENWKNFVNKEKDLVLDIIKNAKTL
jgi:hypothetical protein